MSFADDIADSLTDLFDELPEAILTRDAVDTVCHADVIRGIDLQPTGYNSQVSGDQTIIELLLSEIETEPSRGDIITVGGTTYTVDSIYENDGYTVKVIVI